MDRTQATDPDPEQVDFGLVLLDQHGDPLCTIADTADLDVGRSGVAASGPPQTDRVADR